jgi:hypothetical protein
MIDPTDKDFLAMRPVVVEVAQSGEIVRLLGRICGRTFDEFPTFDILLDDGPILHNVKPEAIAWKEALDVA